MIQEESKLTNTDKITVLSQYVQLNLSAFQSLRNKKLQNSNGYIRKMH